MLGWMLLAGLKKAGDRRAAEMLRKEFRHSLDFLYPMMIILYMILDMGVYCCASRGQ